MNCHNLKSEASWNWWIFYSIYLNVLYVKLQDLLQYIKLNWIFQQMWTNVQTPNWTTVPTTQTAVIQKDLIHASAIMIIKTTTLHNQEQFALVRNDMMTVLDCKLLLFHFGLNDANVFLVSAPKVTTPPSTTTNSPTTTTQQTSGKFCNLHPQNTFRITSLYRSFYWRSSVLLTYFL